MSLNLGIHASIVFDVMIGEPDSERTSRHKEHYFYFVKTSSPFLNNGNPDELSIGNISLEISNNSGNNTPYDAKCLSLACSRQDSDTLSKEFTGVAAIIGFLSGAPITNFGYTDYDSVGNVTCRYLRCPSTLELLIAKDFCFPRWSIEHC